MFSFRIPRHVSYLASGEHPQTKGPRGRPSQLPTRPERPRAAPKTACHAAPASPTTRPHRRNASPAQPAHLRRRTALSPKTPSPAPSPPRPVLDPSLFSAASRAEDAARALDEPVGHLRRDLGTVCDAAHASHLAVLIAQPKDARCPDGNLCASKIERNCTSLQPLLGKRHHASAL